MLMLSSLVVAWLVMPYVAVIKTAVYVYTMTGLSNAKVMRGVRLLLLLGFACFVYFLCGFFAGTWALYIPGCIFVGFLCNSPLSVNRRRGLIGLLALSLSQGLANGVLLTTGSLTGVEPSHGASQATGHVNAGDIEPAGTSQEKQQRTDSRVAIVQQSIVAVRSHSAIPC